MDVAPTLGVNHVISCVVVFVVLLLCSLCIDKYIYLIVRSLLNINFAGILSKGLSKALFVYLTAKLNK